MDIENKELKQAFADEGIMLLKSDNICIGGRIPLPNGAVAIVVKESEDLHGLQNSENI